MQAAARQLVEQYDGMLPADAAALRRLPGIGRYTAGAIASIAFELREPVLDGNVRRVLSRLLAADPGEARLWEIAAGFAAGPRPGEANQALMELGALVCSPRRPACETCPLRRGCRAFASGRPEAFPARRSVPPVERVRVAVALIDRGGKVLLERPGASSPLRGSWDLPAREISAKEAAGAELQRRLAREYKLQLSFGPKTHALTHGIMQRRLELRVHAGRLRRGRVAGREELRWLDPRRLDEAAISGATRKVLRAAGLAG
jgi:A/G-specific adenine glycosylase